MSFCVTLLQLLWFKERKPRQSLSWAISVFSKSGIDGGLNPRRVNSREAKRVLGADDDVSSLCGEFIGECLL